MYKFIIQKYIRNLLCYKRIQKYIFSLYEKFSNNIKEVDFEVVAREASCFSCFKKDINFMVKELNNMIQAFIKASKIFHKIFKNELNFSNVSFIDIHKEEFWRRLTDDVYIRCIIKYIKLNDSVKQSKEVFDNIEEECKIYSNGMNDLITFLKNNNYVENTIVKDNSTTSIDLEELINQINVIEEHSIKKKKKNRLDIEIDQFKKILIKETVHSFKIHKIKPNFTIEWIENLNPK